ncbi:MAG: hypothetical protein AAFQ82_27195 [Myxococcota bacterium]
MTTPGKSGTTGPAPDLKGRLVDWATRSSRGARDNLRERWGDFRATSIYFQLKTLVLAI